MKLKPFIAVLLLFIPCAAFAQRTTLPPSGGITSVSALPATCTPGVTGNVQGSAAITISGQTYPIGTEYWCSATNTWSPVQATVAFSSIPGTPGVSGVPVTNGLMAEYRILPTENLDALTDYSGNSRNCSAHVGTIPNGIVAGTGGVNFTGSGALPCPAALNSALTIEALVSCTANQINNAGAGFIAGSTSPAVEFGAKISFTNGINFNDPNSQYACRLLMFNNTVGTTTYSRMAISSNPKFVSATLSATGSDNIYSGSQLSVGTGTFGFNNYTFVTTGASGGIQTTGQYQIGGSSLTNFWYGTVYYAVFYNRVLSATEISQNSNYILNVVAPQRGITLLPNTSAANTVQDVFACDGDSLSAGNGLTLAPFCGMTTGFAPIMVFNTSPNGSTFAAPYENESIPGNNATGLVTFAGNVIDPFYNPASQRNIVHWWTGVNPDCPGGVTNCIPGKLIQYAQGRHAIGWKVLAATMASAIGNITDVQRDNFNTWMRANWPLYLDSLTDFAKNIHIGADGANSSTTYFQSAGNVHPSQGAHYNILAPIVQHETNALYGNRGFSTANTYAAASATVALTACSEAANIVTCTVAASAPPAGACVIIVGVTPSGYNSGSQTGGQNDDCWFVLSSSGGTSFTYFNYTSGLGAGTVFGTVQQALQQDADINFIVNIGAGNVLLQPCYLFNDQELVTVRNINAAASTLVPFGAVETITGAGAAPTTLAANTTAILQSKLVSASAAGCNWVRLQ